MSIRIAIVAPLLACAFAFSVTARADRIVLHNGRTLDGQVVAEDETSYTVQVEVGSSTLTQRFTKSQVRSVARVAQARATYVTLPVIGAIGEDVTAAALRAGFAEARATKVGTVVLAIDSPGGEVREMAGMIEAVAEASEDIHVVALVKSAHSAAAVVAMTCPRVYMTPGATIGATVPFRITDKGPADVDAKMRSIIQATMRAAAAAGGHADLLIRGMSEMELEIFLTTDEVTGEPRLATTGPGKVIKSKGQILTLTADEAVDCGLATIAKNLGHVGAHESVDGEWTEGPRRPWQAVIGHVALAKWRLEQRYAELRARYLKAVGAVSQQYESHTTELVRIESDYTHAMRAAEQKRIPQAAMARAEEQRSARLAAARRAHEAAVAPLAAARDALAMEAAELLAQHPDLLARVAKE